MPEMNTFTVADFAPHVGEVFTMRVEDGDPVELILEDAQPLGQSVRDGGSFSLVFTTAEDAGLLQQLTPLAHDRFGDLSLFLVPIGPFGRGMGYEAIFT